jgi:tetratricopeptide (TPR) repeat protein
VTTAADARRLGRRLDLLVFAATAACFAGALRNQFVWDDWALVARTVGFRGFDLRHLFWMFTTRHMTVYMPLPWLSYAVDYAVWGLNPLGYHLTNVLLHAAAATLFRGLARRVLAASLPGTGGAELELGATAAALAFALHPLRVESVAWISERRDVLAGLFFMPTLIWHWDAAAARGARRRTLLALSVAAYACAALSKASVAPLPAVLLLLDVYPLRRLGAGRAGTAAVLVEKIPYVLIAAATALMAVYAHASTGSLEPLSSYGAGSRVAQAVYGLGFYLSKTAVPTGLCALYPRPRSLGFLDARVLAGAAAVAACALVLRLAVPERRARLALWGVYAALLLPVLGFLQNGPQAVALRYSYLSCLGWAILVGAAAARASRAARAGGTGGRAAAGALALWLALCVGATQAQLSVWRDDASLWSRVLALSPDSPDADENMAEALMRAGDWAGAEALARRALASAPADRAATLLLASAEARQGRLEPARAALVDALAAAPDWGEGRLLLGTILSQQGADDEALVQLRRAAELDPGSARALGAVGAALARRGRFEEAAAFFAAAARAAPDEPRYAELLRRAEADRDRAAPR